MNDREFVDFYEILQVSQNADTETIERVFRLLAKRYHPDNNESGDEERFRQLHTAYEVLTDPELRARFDVHYDHRNRTQWKILTEGGGEDTHGDDRRIMNGVLSLLYRARRRDPENGGIGAIELERMLGVPREHLEFPLWILKQRGWIEVLDTGQRAITIEGVDQVIHEGLDPVGDRLLPRAAARRQEEQEDEEEE